MLLEILGIAYRHAPRLVVAAVVMAGIGAGLEAVGLLFLAPLMAVLTNVPVASLGWPLDAIAARFAAAGPKQAVLVFAAIFGALTALRFAVMAGSLSLVAEIEVRMLRFLRLRCLAVLFFAPQSFLDGYDNARIVQHFNEQSMRAGETLRIVLRAVTSAATFVANLAVLFVLSVPLTLSVLILLLLVSAMVSFVPRRLARNAERFVGALYEYNVRIGDLVAGIKTVRSYATFSREQKIVRDVLERQIRAHKGKVFFSGVTAPLFEALGFITLCIILAASVFLVSSSQWLAILAPFVVILARTIPIASSLNSVRSVVISNQADYAALKQFTEHLPGARGPETTLDAPFDRLALEGVTFSYHQGRTVLRDVSLTVRKGERLLIVGPSGAGKTTILNLMLGLYEPSEGTVLVNGTDLKVLDREAWAGHVGVVEQSPFVFNDTVRANIAYRDTSVSAAAIERALAAVGLLDVIESMPLKLDSELGDAGGQLSGGQRQRLAFARALCHEPDLLILDEPTSALDRNTEATLLDGVSAGYPGITIVAVSHSEAMHGLFDRVVRIEAGTLTSMTDATLP